MISMLKFYPHFEIFTLIFFLSSVLMLSLTRILKLQAPPHSCPNHLPYNSLFYLMVTLQIHENCVIFVVNAVYCAGIKDGRNSQYWWGTLNPKFLIHFLPSGFSFSCWNTYLVLPPCIKWYLGKYTIFSIFFWYCHHVFTCLRSVACTMLLFPRCKHVHPVVSIECVYVSELWCRDFVSVPRHALDPLTWLHQ